jgi:hypothetical protein
MSARDLAVIGELCLRAGPLAGGPPDQCSVVCAMLAAVSGKAGLWLSMVVEP